MEDGAGDGFEGAAEAADDRGGEYARRCNGHPVNHDQNYSTRRAREGYLATLKRKWQTSPSWTTYSLPSRRSWPFERRSANEPSTATSSS